MESLQSDTDRDVRFFSGGQINDRTSSLRLLDEVDYDRHLQNNDLYGGVRIIERGIHEYALNDGEFEDDDSQLVEEVYIENSPGDLIIEEYYMEGENSENGHHEGEHTHSPAQIFVEEIVEEIIETIGTPNNDAQHTGES